MNRTWHWFAAAASLLAFGGPQEKGPPPTADLRLDSRLGKAVTVQLNRVPCADLLAELGTQTSVTLSADERVAQERVILLVNRAPLREVMQHLADLYHSEWIVGERGAGSAYILRKPDSVLDAEKREQAVWRKKQQELHNARIRMLANLMQTAVDSLDLPPDQQRELLARDPFLTPTLMEGDGKSLLGQLSSLDPDERQAIAESSLNESGIISATKNSHMIRNMSDLRPISSLSPDQRSAITAQARSAGAKGDIDNLQVGFFGANGSLGLAVTDGEDAWANGAALRAPDSPELYDALKGAAAAGRSGREARIPGTNDPDVIQSMSSKYDSYWDAPNLRDLRLSKSLGAKLVSFSSIDTRYNIGTFLAAIHAQTGIPIIADGLIHSSRALDGAALRGADKWATRDACAQLCLVFRRKIFEADGWLTVVSRRQTIYRLFEPPQDKVKEWVAKKQGKGLRFEDFAEMAAVLTTEQIQELQSVPLNITELREEALSLGRLLPAYRLWNRLSAVQKEQLSGPGLNKSELDKESIRDFWRLWIRSARGGAVSPPMQPGLQLVSSSYDCTLRLSSRSTPVDIRTIRLPLKRNP